MEFYAWAWAKAVKYMKNAIVCQAVHASIFKRILEWKLSCAFVKKRQIKENPLFQKNANKRQSTFFSPFFHVFRGKRWCFYMLVRFSSWIPGILENHFFHLSNIYIYNIYIYIHFFFPPFFFKLVLSDTVNTVFTSLLQADTFFFPLNFSSQLMMKNFTSTGASCPAFTKKLWFHCETSWSKACEENAPCEVQHFLMFFLKL